MVTASPTSLPRTTAVSAGNLQRPRDRLALLLVGITLWIALGASVILDARPPAEIIVLYPLLTLLFGWGLGNRPACMVSVASIGMLVMASGLGHLAVSAATAGAFALVCTAYLVSLATADFRRQRMEAVQLSEELAEQFLHAAQREHELNLVIENAPAMIAAADENFRFRYVNRRYADFLGQPPENLVGKYIPDALTDTPGDTIADLLTALKDRKAISYRRDVRLTNELPRVIAVDVVPYQDLTGKPLSLAMIRDITEQARAETALAELNASLEERVAKRTVELRQAYETLERSQAELSRAERMAALGTLIAGLSHELGTPLGNSMITASLINDSADKLRQAVAANHLKRTHLDAFLGQLSEASQLLQRNLQRAEELLLSFKRVAVDQASEQRRRFNLRTTVDDILDTLSPTLRHKPQRITVDMADDLILDSYPGPFGQVLINLINNAFLHAFEGRDDGILRVAAKAVDADHVLFTVADDGAGIPASVKPHLFEPFFTTKSGAGGTGLGLSIVYNIVTDLLGGDITVESVAGQGSTFILMLPRTAPAATPP